MKKNSILIFICIGLIFCLSFFNFKPDKSVLSINDKDYFEMPGLDIIVFQDYYPSGHQSGITIVQNGVRVAANGDLRLGGVAEIGPKKVYRAAGTIQIQLNYPKIPLQYIIQVKAEGKKIIVTADLDQPLPSNLVGRAWFQLELFPTILFGKSWNMDGQTGIFPTDAYGPMAGGGIKPYAEGKVLAVAPESENQRMTIKALKGSLQLVDDRSGTKAGWFVVRTAIPRDQTKGVIQWEIEAVPVNDYNYTPVIHISQVGYLPNEPKKAVIELDKRTGSTETINIMKINPDGTRTKVFFTKAVLWGKFLRYNYAIGDFSNLRDPGMYEIHYGNVSSNIFKISDDVFERYVWQPTLEYFLPVQMCHMRVVQGPRVWHDWCHLDDAIMAPTNLVHFDQYKQGPETFTKYQNPQHVPYLDHGGWHDAGDFDLRIESQAVTTWRLAMMQELFGIDLDVTTIDQNKRIVEINRPDGISDILQQVEHGVLTILGGYRGLGRLYRGMISPTSKQYSLQGDASAQTDNLLYNPTLPQGTKTATESSVPDDNWVFTENNPGHELTTAAALASASRVLKSYRPEMSAECLKVAEDLYNRADQKVMRNERIAAAAELFLTTKNRVYLDTIVAQKKFILTHISGTAWAIGMVYKDISDINFRAEMDKALKSFSAQLEKEDAGNPFGVPYKPDIWGDGWNIQSKGVQFYFLVTGFPGLFKPDRVYNALQFILGCHPGINTSTFASGVGAKSLTSAYGFNRADYSYIPGGVASGTAIIRPDLPELKENYSFFWPQAEYVMGGGAENFMFLVLATDQLLKNHPKSNNN